MSNHNGKGFAPDPQLNSSWQNLKRLLTEYDERQAKVVEPVYKRVIMRLRDVCSSGKD